MAARLWRGMFCNLNISSEFIAEKSGAVVVYPEYRLAPETAFPGQIEDCVLALDYVREHAGDLGIDPHKIMVAGDSAGGSLTNACVQLRGAGAVAHAFEIYPEVDLAGEQGEGYEGFSCDSRSRGRCAFSHRPSSRFGRPDGRTLCTRKNVSS